MIFERILSLLVPLAARNVQFCLLCFLDVSWTLEHQRPGHIHIRTHHPSFNWPQTSSRLHTLVLQPQVPFRLLLHLLSIAPSITTHRPRPQLQDGSRHRIYTHINNIHLSAGAACQPLRPTFLTAHRRSVCEQCRTTFTSSTGCIGYRGL